MIYLAGWFLVYYYLAVRFFLQRHVRWLSILVILALGSIAILRGSVGTDTTVYERLAAHPREWAGIEPGFWVLLYLLHALIGDPIAIVRGVALLFTMLLLWFACRADDDELLLLMGFVLPVFFFNLSMNTIRVGLGLALLLLALQMERRQHPKAQWLALTTPLFHYSLVLALLFLWIVTRPLRPQRLREILIPIGVLLIAFLMVALNEAYFAFKLRVYASFEAPSGLSGLSKLILGLILVSALPFTGLPRAEMRRLLFWALLFLGLSFGVTRLTYAGLRLLDLVVFLIPVAIFRLYARENRALDPVIKNTLIVAGLLGAAGMYRNMVLERFWSPSPWLPYHTIFDR
ncbi:EpsG family protein [Rhodothermus marinus]|uniref:EpsG family protein n=1 Tax=Rhodothermus marinus TaxID=29549 RepID=UPI0037CC846A